LLLNPLDCRLVYALQPKLVAVSNFIKFANPKAPLYPRLSQGKSWDEVSLCHSNSMHTSFNQQFQQSKAYLQAQATENNERELLGTSLYTGHTD
jgi:uncharacterized protein with von Willebrand factor type A (vWA) domain